MWKFKDCYSAPNLSGVYAIINTLNNKKYIGSTKHFKHRFAEHRSELRGNYHKNKHLQNAYNKYGENYFVFEILETCDNVQDTLNFIEQKWIDSDGDYNICPIANRRTYTKLSKEHKEKLLASKLGKPLTEQTKKKISNALRGRKPSKAHLLNQSNGRKGKGTKPVEQYTLDGKYVNTFNSLTEAGNFFKGSYVDIMMCCKGKICSAFNFLWKYKSDPRTIFEVIKKRSEGNRRKVYKLDKNTDEILQEYESIRSAAIDLGGITKSSLISHCLAGRRRIAFGYKWKYKI